MFLRLLAQRATYALFLKEIITSVCVWRRWGGETAIFFLSKQTDAQAKCSTEKILRIGKYDN